MVGRGRTFFRHDTVDTETMEQQRHRQADRAASDDKDRCAAD
jgi:hypothetical protein